MKPKSFSLHSRLDSLRFACNGIRRFFRQEPNAWLHLTATIGVGMAACYFPVSRREMIALVMVIGFVWFAEAINTVIERIMDFISTGHHHEIAFIKDLSAGAVLIAAATALLTGALVFIPKIF
jgi:diacylglycerol kinase